MIRKCNCEQPPCQEKSMRFETVTRFSVRLEWQKTIPCPTMFRLLANHAPLNCFSMAKTILHLHKFLAASIVIYQALNHTNDVRFISTL